MATIRPTAIALVAITACTLLATAVSARVRGAARHLEPPVDAVEGFPHGEAVSRRLRSAALSAARSSARTMARCASVTLKAFPGRCARRRGQRRRLLVGARFPPADERPLGVGAAPRLRRHAAQRQPRRPDVSTGDFEGRGRRRQRERERGPIAHLHVARAGRERRRGERHVRDELAVLEDGLCLRMLAGQRVQVGDGDRAPLAANPRTCTTASSATSATHMSDG